MHMAMLDIAYMKHGPRSDLDGRGSKAIYKHSISLIAVRGLHPDADDEVVPALVAGQGQKGTKGSCEYHIYI